MLRVFLEFFRAAGVLIVAGAFATIAFAQTEWKIADIPTRTGVTQRILYAVPASPAAAVILFAGGHGGLQLAADGAMRWGAGNFLVRTRNQFVGESLMTVVVDAPSDKQSPPYLGGFRQRPDHVTDIKAVIAWLRERHRIPVWLAGTSRGTQSAAYVATEAAPREGGPDGLVLTSTILTGNNGRPVPSMPLERLKVPVLVVHHEQDGCRLCAFGDIPRLMDRLKSVPRSELIAIAGGESIGDPCEAQSHHGFRGQERDVVAKIGGWIRSTIK